MLTIVLSLAAALGWAFHDFIIQPATRRAGPFTAMFWAMLTSTAILLTAALAIDGIPTSSADWTAVGIAGVGGILYVGGVACLLRALSVGDLSLVTPLAALMGGVGSVMAIILGEQIGVWAVVAIALAVAGAAVTSIARPPVVALAGERGEAIEVGQTRISAKPTNASSIDDKADCPVDAGYPAMLDCRALPGPRRVRRSWRTAHVSAPRAAAGSGFALVAALLFGMAFVVYGYADDVSAVTAAAWGRLAGMMVFVPIALARVKLTMPARVYVRTTTAGGLDSLAYVAMTAALALGPVSVASVLSSQFAVFAVVLGMVVLHERPSPVQCCGLVLTLSAIVLFALFV
jgi:drug/metabolite transporter (DMT)-like permease